MCGIAGFVDRRNRLAAESYNNIVQEMTGTMVHRGPDSGGSWSDPVCGVAIGHRRLAIIDLTEAGHQPMVSRSGRFVISYNGEIYSFPEMRQALGAQGVVFRGDSDTEVILEGFERWGIPKTLSKMIGMFAIALWDREGESLTLIRDRLGIKPLYWSFVDDALVFASELKALSEFPGWSPRIDRDATAAYMRHMYVPAPRTIYQGVSKLEPGTMLILKPGARPVTECYWDFEKVALQGLATRHKWTEEDAANELEELLKDAVKRRMISDVPLGSLLSGGIDSSLVTALMQSQSEHPVRSFAVGFDEEQYNEAPFASKVAKALGTDHTELTVRSADALDIIPGLADWYDEPFADASQIPTYLVCKLTKQHVTVVLSGDGGDELFCGYSRYLQGAGMLRRFNLIPVHLRRGLMHSLKVLPEAGWDGIGRLLPRRIRPMQLGRKVHKAANGLAELDGDAFYRQVLSHWTEPEKLVLGSSEPKGVLWDPRYKDLIPDFAERMQFFDTLTYLPDDILTKVDRASMAVSLEARVPLLDHRVVQFAWGLPADLKVRRGRGKFILRKILGRYLPHELIDRPKMGFGAPIDVWLRGPLRDWAESLIDKRRLEEQGLLEPGIVREKWHAHLNGENWAYHLWDVLMLQEWLDRNPASLGL